MTFSATVNHSNRAPCWKTIPLATPGPSISFSFSEIFPEVGLKNPAVILSKVVFPQPDGPRTVSNSPFFKVKFTSFKAWTVSPLGVLKNHIKILRN